MDFTGERFTPDCVREIWYEHWHRYAFAARLVEGLNVLDLASGEGYGAALLARQADRVLGVDIAQDAVDHARQAYTAANLSYVQGSAAEIPAEDHAFDVVVSFETIEHLEPQAEMLAEFRRVLKPGGFAIISSPDKAVYSDETGFVNEHHVRELYRDEFVALLAAQFPAVRLYGQKLLFQSVIWSPGEPAPATMRWEAARNQEPVKGLPGYRPVYWIALCADSEQHLPSSESVSLFGDEEESVYDHYNHEIRKNMQAGGLLADRDQEIERLKAELQATADANRPWWTRLLGRSPRKNDD